MSWLNIETDEVILVLPETDSRPHGIQKRKNSKTVEIAGIECLCKPRVSLGDFEDGVYGKPMIIHNSFREMEKVEEAMNSFI